MFKLTGKLTLSITGVNIKRLIKTFYKKNIDIFYLEQNSFRNIYITIYSKDYKKAKKYLCDYKVEIKKRFGTSFLKNFCKTSVGLIIGACIFLSLLVLNTNFLNKIYIYGTTKIDNSEIIACLKQNGITENKFYNNINVENLEKILENNFDDISLVSVIKKGTNLIINLKEKLFVEDLSSSNIIAKESGQILELNVVQGSSPFKVGDSVKKGEVLINGYSIVNGKKVECKAIGFVKLKVWYSSSYTFLNEEVHLVRTGKKIVNTSFEIFNFNFLKTNYKNNFENYEEEIKSEYIFKNFLLPIKINKKIFYEIKENVVKNEFSFKKDDIIKETTKLAKEQVPTGEEILNIFTEITETEIGKIITTYVETIQSFS